MSPPNVQVFVCPTFPKRSRRTEEEPHDTKTAPRFSQSQSQSQSQSKSKSTRHVRLRVKDQYEATMKSVRAFSVEGMTKGEKKLYEKDQFQLLGGKTEKNEKMPYWLLMRRARRTQNREVQEAQETKEADVVKAKYVPLVKKKKMELKRHQQRYQSQYRDRGLHVTQGRFKRGVLHVNPNDIQQRSKKTKRF